MSDKDLKVWCLLGKKAGDNTQVLALADELALPYEEKRVSARSWELITHLRQTPTLAGIDAPSVAQIRPPWPDVVITAGRRNEHLARWIKATSGGKALLVQMGRPWSRLQDWDLIVTTPQYFLPSAPNIVHNSLPLHRLSRCDLKEDAKRVQPLLGELARPWIALLIGGDSGRFVFTPEKGRRLGELTNRLAATCGGSVLASDSPRTPVAAGDAVEQALLCPHYHYRWQQGGQNPYRGLLALADAFVVTGESMSMLAEAAAMARPLFIFDMGDSDLAWWRLAHSYRYKPLSHRFAMTLGPQRMRRDIGRIQMRMVADREARWLDEAGVEAAAKQLKLPIDRPQGDEPTSSVDLHRAADAVRRLLAERSMDVQVPAAE